MATRTEQPLPNAACSCSSHRRTAPRGWWRALPSLLLALLTPKCPGCLLALAATVSATGLPLAVHLDPRVLTASTVALLAGVVLWLGVRRGRRAGGVALLAAVVVIAGKFLLSNLVVAGCGVGLLVLYLLFEDRLTANGAPQ